MANGSDGISLTDHLLYMILDQLRLQTWMKTKDAVKRRNRPKPLSPLAQATSRAQRFGDSGGRSSAEIKSMLAKYGPERERK